MTGRLFLFVVIRVYAERCNDGNLWRKKSYCPYCEKQYSKVSGHLKTVHKTEKDVIQYMSCKDRRMKGALMTRLRNLGNHFHNRKVLRSGEGTFIVTYTPKTLTEPKRNGCFLPCVYCLGYYNNSTLWKHVSRCIFGKNKSPADKHHTRHAQLGRMLLASGLHASSQVRRLTSKMNNDAITCVVKEDSLIKRLGSLFCLMHGFNRHKRSEIRRSLRLAAQLLIELRKLVPGVTSLADFINPVYFKYFVQAASFLAQSNKGLAKSKMSKIGWLLKKAAMFIQTDDIRNLSSEKRDTAYAFEKLILKEWNMNSSSSGAKYTTLTAISKDVKTLSDYLTEKICWHSKYLTEDGGNALHFDSLQQALLAFIIIFNMRRGSAVSNMTIQEFESSLADSLSSQHRLSEMEHEQAKQLACVKVNSRKECVIPILLTDSSKRALRLLISCRKSVGIPVENQNVFVNSDGVLLLGYSSLKKATEECGAKRPKILWASQFRKTVMTMTQIFNFEKRELDALADYLDIDIGLRHMFYRLPHDTTQVAKVSKLITLRESGKFENYAKQSLEELDLNIEEQLEGKCWFY